MSPIDTNVIQDKLFRLREVTALLEDLRKMTSDVFLKDPVQSSAAMYNMIIAIEVIVDIGNHILAEHFQKPARTYRDVILGLGETNVIPELFVKENEFMADFRNKLIHDYDRVRLEYVFEILQKAPEIFRQFAAYYIQFLEKNAAEHF